MMHTILLVEAERALGESLSALLIADGYRVELARTAEHARELARASEPAVVLLGRFDAPSSPPALLDEIRAAPSGATWPADVPAIVLGGDPRELELQRAFEAGADDFLARPVHYLELRLRLRALLKRCSAPGRPTTLRVGRLLLDTRARSVTFAARPLALRRREFDLLAHLAGEPERVFTRRELLVAVWGHRASVSTRTLDGHASRLRAKLGAASGARWVIGVRGVGYRLI